MTDEYREHCEGVLKLIDEYYPSVLAVENYFREKGYETDLIPTPEGTADEGDLRVRKVGEVLWSVLDVKGYQYHFTNNPRMFPYRFLICCNKNTWDKRGHLYDNIIIVDKTLKYGCFINPDKTAEDWGTYYVERDRLGKGKVVYRCSVHHPGLKWVTLSRSNL